MQRRILVVMVSEIVLMLVVGVVVFFASRSGLAEAQIIVVVVAAVAVSFLFSTILLTMMLLPKARLRGLRKTGIQAGAFVLGDAGYRESSPRFSFPQISDVDTYAEIKVRVQRGDMLPYEAVVWVGQAEAACIKPGMYIQVRCDPNRPQVIMLDDTAQAIMERNNR
jgi:hypothetical protein